jgi:hypothetical protein
LWGGLWKLARGRHNSEFDGIVLALGDRMLVPWYPGESNFEGEKGVVACTTPVSDPSSSWFRAVEAVKPGREVNLGRRGMEEVEVEDLGSDRHAPLNAYDPKLGN